MKKNIRLIVAVAAGVIAVFLVMSYMKQQEQVISERFASKAKAVKSAAATVLIARTNIPQGTTLSEKELQLKNVPQEYIQPRAATSPERVLGRVTTAPIEAGEQILLTKLALPESASSLSMKTPPGKRAITIPIDNISNFSGMLRPSDHVDVMVTMMVPSSDAQGKVVQQPMVLPLFQNTLVLAVGADLGTGGSAQSRTSANTVTFALTPQEASILAYVQEQSKLRLVLRSPGDSAPQQLSAVSPQVLFQYLSSQMTQAPQEEKKEVKQKEQPTVQVYRGTQKQVVNLGE